MGKMMEQTATLDVTSVAVDTMTQRIEMRAQWGITARTSSWLPIMVERPETVHALAMAKPPPRSRTRDQGIFLCMTCQWRRASEGLDEATAI